MTVDRLRRFGRSFVAAMLLFLTLSAFEPGGNHPAGISNVLASTGLEIGQKAPAFALADQFDRPQSNDTLRGANGTVLLFFRSADW